MASEYPGDKGAAGACPERGLSAPTRRRTLRSDGLARPAGWSWSGLGWRGRNGHGGGHIRTGSARCLAGPPGVLLLWPTAGRERPRFVQNGYLNRVRRWQIGLRWRGLGCLHARGGAFALFRGDLSRIGMPLSSNRPAAILLRTAAWPSGKRCCGGMRER